MKVLTAIRTGVIKVFDVIYFVLLQYAMWELLVIILFVCADVVARNFLGFSVSWSQEVSLLLIVWMTFLSMAIGVEKGYHIGIELFYQKFPKSVRAVIDTVNKFIFLLVGIFMGYYGWKLTASTWTSTLAATKWPAGLLYAMIPVGGYCMAFFALLDLIGWKKYKNTSIYEDAVADDEEDVEQVLELLKKEGNL